MEKSPVNVTTNLYAICRSSDTFELNPPPPESLMVPDFYFLNSTQGATTLIDFGPYNEN